VKVQPVSADLLIKLGLGAVVLIGGAFVIRSIIGSAGDAAGRVWDGAGDLASKAWRTAAESASTTFNPASDQNLIYGGISAAGESITGVKDWTLGSALYDLFNPDQPDPTAPAAPSDYGDVQRLKARYPGYTSASGGAVFPILPPAF
jgi:hypothetical protein